MGHKATNHSLGMTCIIRPSNSSFAKISISNSTQHATTTTRKYESYPTSHELSWIGDLSLIGRPAPTVITTTSIPTIHPPTNILRSTSTPSNTKRINRFQTSLNTQTNTRTSRLKSRDTKKIENKGHVLGETQ